MALNDFLSKFNRGSSAQPTSTSYQNPFTQAAGSLQSMMGGATQPGQVNAQNTPSASNPQPRSTGVQQGPQRPQQQPAERYGSPQIGYFDNYEDAVTAANRSMAQNNPASVNLNIGDTTPGEALNTTPSGTSASERRKGRERNILKSRYDKEEEELMESIMSLRTGIADLTSTQAREFADLEENPEGKLMGNLRGALGRLSKDQALELNARTGQLNAYLDNLELYQGYRPEIVGTPQIDEATGNAFVYVQDPQTGEFAVQDLGQVTTPGGGGDSFTLGKDQVRYDAEGNVIAKGVSGSSGGSAGGESVPYYSDLLAKGIISLSNVPQSIRNQVVVDAAGNINKGLTPGQTEDIVELMNGLDGLRDIKTLIETDPDLFGPISGLAALNPYSKSRKAQADLDRTRQKIGKALEGGVLRKEDEEKYKKILARITDTPSTAAHKIESLINDIETDLFNYRNINAAAGRYVPDTGSQTSLEDINF